MKEKDFVQTNMKVCQLCDNSTPDDSRIGQWIASLRVFWSSRPAMAMLFDNGYIILLVASIMFNMVEALQPYAAVPFAAFIVLYGLSEYVPLSSMPFSTTNAITGKSTKYIGAMSVVTHLVVMTLFFGLLMELFHPTDPEALTKRVVSVSTLAIPMVALSYLLVAR